jgi:hypothetical protein
LNTHLKAIQSPWERGSMFLWSAKTFNCYIMQKSKGDHHLLNHHCENLKTHINFFLTFFSLRRWYQPESRHQTKYVSVLSSSPNRDLTLNRDYKWHACQYLGQFLKSWEH